IDSKNYILVLEYANEGNLRKYLKKNFTSLKWTVKIQMALDITSGLKFLHSKGIIHRDLHSKNILVNDRKLLIADLGLSKKLAEITTHSKGNKYGMDGYIDPQCFKDRKYKKNKKSDIYSLGVLLWEISSGRPPFSDCSRNLITHYIIKGEREDPIEGTPLKYQQLYQECWDDNPESRPDIEKVHEILSQLCNEDSFDLQSSRILSNSDYSMEYIENNYRGGMLTFL
ncbi:kinase-like protein, partial [Rhizophagus irregularis]